LEGFSYILWPFGTFCGYLVYLKVIWDILSGLVCCTKKNLATLFRRRSCKRTIYLLKRTTAGSLSDRFHLESEPLKSKVDSETELPDFS
jgi:hypothetical protein